MEGNSLFAWQEFDRGTGEWGIIAVAIPGLRSLPGLNALVFSTERVAQKAKELAYKHGEASGNTIRLARFNLVETLDERRV